MRAALLRSTADNDTTGAPCRRRPSPLIRAGTGLFRAVRYADRTIPEQAGS